MHRARLAFLGSALLLLASTAACARHAVLHSDYDTQPVPKSKRAPATGPLTPAEIAERTLPSVVSIHGQNSLGSGFVVKAEGWIATNFHVLAASGTEIKVVLRDGTSTKVKAVIAADPDHDLALLAIDKRGLPELMLADTDGVKAGDPVVAIGHPMGLEDTVSDGLVSAVRKIEPGLTLLQISAPIAPGSSGGPLIDNRGRVIGIATAVSREGQNLAFGVPADYLKELMKHPEPLAWADFVVARSAAMEKLRPKRNVPQLDLITVAGCGDGDLRLLLEMMGRAVDVGAPLFNKGDPGACYHVYEGASLDIDRKLSVSCKGARLQLAAGRRKAASLSDPAEQAWALRDTFDSLQDVIKRKIEQR
jgi:serine protease Do